MVFLMFETENEGVEINECKFARGVKAKMQKCA